MGFSSGFGVGQIGPKGEEDVKADTGSSIRLIVWLRARKGIMPVYPPIGLPN